MLSEIIKSEIIKDLLPIIDDFDRLLQNVNDDEHEIVSGIKLIHRKFLETLEEQGLKPVKTVGEKFNPKFHEALLVEFHEETRDDEVTEEWRKGYYFNEKLLRPAQVKVNKLHN